MFTPIRHYLAANLISLTGSWIHYVSIYYLAFYLSKSSSVLGFLGFLSGLPLLLFSVFGGILGDKLPRQKTVVFFQALLAGINALLGLLVYTEHLSIILLFSAAVACGILFALKTPVKQSFLADCVTNKASLSQIISFNAFANHLARILGAVIAGSAIAHGRVELAFSIGALAFLISGWLFYQITPVIKHKNTSMTPLSASLRHSFAYLYSQKALFYVIVVSGCLNFCIGPYTSQLPSFAHHLFAIHPHALASFYILSGAGGLIAALLLRQVKDGKIAPESALILGILTASCAMMIFLHIESFLIAGIFLFFTAFGILFASGAGMIYIQHHVDEAYRGRIFGFYQMLFLGLSPISTGLFGFWCDKYTNVTTFTIGSIILIGIMIPYFFYTRAQAKTKRVNSRL